MRHAEFSLYKKRNGRRTVWYARFWNYELGRWAKYRSMEVEAKGARGGFYEAGRRAREMLKRMHGASGVSAAEYVVEFWQPGSRYNQEKIMRSQRPYSASYLDTNRAIAKNEIARFPAFQEKTLAELSAGAIRSYQLSLFNAGKSADRINKIIHALSVPLRDAYERGELDSNPLAGVKDIPVTRKEKGILTDGEIEKLRAADIDLKLKAAIFLGLFSGLRLGEVRGLLWRDLEYAHINVRHNFQTKDGLKNPKYDSFGKTPLPKETKNLLEKLPRDSTYVLSYNGGAIGYDWFNKGIHKAYKAIGVEREEQKERLLTFQSLRHTFATTSQIKYGLSPIEAMSVMRHKSQRMTYHYTHARQSPDSALEKMRAIGAHGKAHDFSTGRGMENEKNQKKLKKSPEFLKNAVMSQVKI